MTAQPSYRWMATLLDILVERFDKAAAMTLLRDESARDTAMLDLAEELQRAGMPAGMLDTHEGSSLFLAVLALRLKFPLDVAHEKVQRNIDMREGRI
jgi:hypothetical protein